MTKQLSPDAPERAIAIVGASCRLPGGIHDLDALWETLREGRNAVGEIPEDRFDARRFVAADMARTGRSYTAAGAFLDDIAGFDAGYFGISPKEAAQMDPQHRLLLELAAEALDDAAIAPVRLAGTDTAVYVGISDATYGAQHALTLEQINPYTMLGAASSIAANRLSHAFDLRGPSMAVDTACSSSLVALDRACHTLWEGTSRAALCGGANMLLSPLHYVGFSQASMLSPRGRCAAFSAQADGFARAEGGGLVVLKRLPDALADGDRVLGVILGTGTNSDGRTAGIALPSAQAQEELLRRVYAQAGVDPDELIYFEAHGTGTAAGDPLEAQAIGRALGVRRITGALPVGSIKTNLGHLEPASGIAGLCKALLVLRHGIAPASLHADTPNPDIDFTGLGLSLTSEQRQLALPERPVVGVNSFGFGGSNAHVVLTAAPSAPADQAVPEPPAEGLPVLVSARTPHALSAAATAMAERLAHGDAEDFYDLAYTSCRRRGLHEHRAAVFARTPGEAAEGFAALAAQADTGAVEAAAVPAGVSAAAGEAVSGGQVAFVFGGNGSQWAGMGADLLHEHPVFRAAVEQADAELAPRLGWSVVKELQLPPGSWRLEATEIAQPLLFAVQLGIVAVLREHGIAPAMVLGHSVGEVAAACTAGALSLAQAAHVIAERSRAQAATVGLGRMAAAGLTVEEAATTIAPFGQALEVAAVNSANDVTIAGEAGALAALGSRLAERGVFFRDLGLDYAFHSRAMDSQAEPLVKALDGLTPGAGVIPLYSTVTGGRLPTAAMNADHWWLNVRRPVLFASAVEQAAQDGGDIFIEISPHPVLRTYLRRITAARFGSKAVVLPTLRRNTHGSRALACLPAALLAAGADTRWDRYFPRPGRVTTLPAYPWQRERHWTGDKHQWAPNGALVHPMLGGRITAPHPVWEGSIEPGLVPWLADHKVAGSVVMPAAGYAEMALAAGREALGEPVEVEHLDIQSALVVPWAEAPATSIQTSLLPDDGILTITSTTTPACEPRPHGRAQVRALLQPRPAELNLAAVAARCPQHLTGEDHYAACASNGLEYGPAFQVLTGMDIGEGEVLARYRHDTPGRPFTLHPGLLDGALQAGVPLLADLSGDGAAFLPAAIGALRVWAEPSPTGAMWVRERSRTLHEVCWDITLADDDGHVIARLDGCRLRRVSGMRRTPVTVHHTQLRAAPHTDSPAAPSPLPAPSRIGEAAGQRIAALRRQLSGSIAMPLMREAMARRMATVFANLLPNASRSFSVDDLVAAGILDKHRRLCALLIPLMETLGLLVPAGSGRWHLTARQFPITELFRKAAALEPASVAVCSLAARHCNRSEDLLRGDADPLQMLVSDHAAQALEHFYDLAPVTRFHSHVAQALLREIVAAWPQGRTLRILEVGAGTGATTAALLPLLSRERTRYCFTDVSAFFFPRAKSRFAASGFMDYQTFDLAQDPVAQGFTARSFDLVVAGLALHTAPDLAAALKNVATLLAPGGQLLATEAHDPLDLLPYFGCLDSFYGNTDTTLRPHSLLLPRAQWPDLLRRCGYGEVLHASHDTAPVQDSFSVLLAAVPSEDASAPQAPAHAPAPAPPRSDSTAFLVVPETPEENQQAAALQKCLTQGTGTARTVSMTDDEDLWARALQDTHGGETDPARTAVVLLLADVPAGAPADLTARAARRATTLRALTTAVTTATHGTPPELWLVTRPCGTTPALPATHELDAALWGMARSLVNEVPDLKGRRITLERTGDVTHDAGRLARELLQPTLEDEIHLTAADRFVPREAPRAPAQPWDGTVPFTLRVDTPGLSYQLAWQERGLPEPGPGEVLIEVRAAALNYRDIMQSVGLLPQEAIEGTHSAKGCGLECAGVVIACGPGVTDLSPGDRVAAMAPATLASHTVTDARAVWQLPEEMNYTEAATLPVAYATVHYSLHRLAQLRPGETVLVHSAAGGVGLAAIEYAQALGAHVIATAGSDLKRDLLRTRGVEHVLDSRTLDFATGVKEITGGRGVDVVLNSLAGEAMARSLELLRPGGRFIELGKRDIFENRPLSLRPFRNNIAFFGVDLTKLLDDTQEAEALYTGLSTQIRNGTYRPLLHTVYPAARVDEAFKFMQHSHHIGKVVVAFDALDEPPMVERSFGPPRLNAHSTYVVTGGTSGFGAVTAQWLAELGARHVALVSRRGRQAPEADGVLAALTARGVSATVHAADVADLDAMRTVIATIDASGHPVRGVVHCAMHLDDAPLTELSEERIAAVMAPKITGAAVLDTLLRERECDLFLMYSSETGTFGNIKQTPYAAGNLYLEALVRRRRQEGLPGLAIAWGAIADAGYVTRNGFSQAMERFGHGLMPAKDALATATTLLSSRADVAGVVLSDWGQEMRLLPSIASPRLASLLPPISESSGPDGETLLSTLSRMSSSDALDHLTSSLATILAGILQMDRDGIDPHNRLDSYGLDSLMATELLVKLNRRFNVDIPPMELLRSSTGTLTDVAQMLHLRLGLRPAGTPAPDTTIPHQHDRTETGQPLTAPL